MKANESELAAISKYKTEPVPLEVSHHGVIFRGNAKPVSQTCNDQVCFELEVTLNNTPFGRIHYAKDQWRMDKISDKEFVETIGNEIFEWYE